MPPIWLPSYHTCKYQNLTSVVKICIQKSAVSGTTKHLAVQFYRHFLHFGWLILWTKTLRTILTQFWGEIPLFMKHGKFFVQSFPHNKVAFYWIEGKRKKQFTEKLDFYFRPPNSWSAYSVTYTRRLLKCTCSENPTHIHTFQRNSRSIFRIQSNI